MLASGASSLRFRAAIRVEGVIRGELLGHVVVVILRVRLEPGGERVETRRFGRELAGFGIGATHDQCQCSQGRIIELVLLEEGVKRARLAMMAELDARNVV